MNDQTEIETGTALVIPQGTDLVSLFSKPEKVEDTIKRIEQEALSHAPDLSTVKGRKAVASLAYKIAQSKTAMDKAGKSLTEEAQKRIDVVNAERLKVRERLDALKVKVRKPLDDWEAAEEKRKATLRNRIENLALRASQATSEAIKARIAAVESVPINDDWQEFIAEAAKVKDETLAALRADLEAAETREAEQAELARLREEAAAREEADRQRRAAEEAENRRIEAEKAEADRQARIEREKQEAAERATREAEERAQAEKEQAAQEAARREAEHKRLLAEAEARAEAAAKAERDRIAAEKRAEDEARAKREADAAHRANIRSKIVDALATMAGKATPEAIADALMDGRIPHTKVAL